MASLTYHWFGCILIFSFPSNKSPLLPILLGIGSYLLGSIPTGYLLARSRGIDLRRFGSGNIGATNVARALGRKLAVVTFLGDMLKGLIPVLTSLALNLGPEITGAVGLLSFLGHCYPIFLKFRGGKGVATGFGACLGIIPIPSLITLGVWLGTFAFTRISSLSALIAALTLPLLILILDHHRVLYLVLPLITLLIFNHRENIKRLLKGTEAKF